MHKEDTRMKRTFLPSRCAQATSEMRIYCLLALLMAAGAVASAPVLAFDPPWIGYDVGQSAFPGNDNSLERDPTAFITADFDGDLTLDVAVANYEYAAPGGGTDGTSGFAILFNRGDGTYGEPHHYTVSTKGCWDIVAADFDEDEDMDLAVSISDAFWTGQTVRVYLNDGSGSFPTFRTLVAVDGPVGLAAADFDGDGHLDLAATNFSAFEESGLVSIFAGDGNGNFAGQVTYPVGPRPCKLGAADLDGVDGADIVVAHEGQMVSVLFNQGDGTFGPAVAHGQLFPMQGGMYYGCLALADSDMDGDLDVFYGNTRSHQPSYTPTVVHFRNDGGVLTRLADITLTPFAAGPVDLAVGDVDGDEWPDLAAAHFAGTPGDAAWIVLNDGAGGFLPAEKISAGQATFAVALADPDGDGDDDLLTADRFSMMVTVHENTGDRIRQLTTLYGTAAHNIRMDVGDVDGDGDLDVFTSTENFGSEGALVRNNGDGTFAEPVLYTHSNEYGRGVSKAKLRDLDGDQDLDLLYNDALTDFHTFYDFLVALNDGNGNFGPIVEWPLGTCGNGDVDAFDLDGDGDLDVVNLEELACGGGGGNRLFISMNRGDATFDPPFVVQISTGPHNVLGGYFNADEHIDLVTVHWMPYGWRDFINVHLGNGDGTFQEEVVYEVGRGPRWIVSADFNGDEHADLATANSGYDNEGRETLTILFGTGTGAFTNRTDAYAPFSPDLLGVTGLVHGDIDLDGDADLMMTTVAGGAAVYTNDGHGSFSLEPRIGLSWGPWSPFYEDVTGDGIPDLVALTSDGLSGLGRFVAVLPGTEATSSAGDGRIGSAGWPPIRLSQVHPNPMQRGAGRFTVQVAETQRVTVALYDAAGRRARLVHAGEMSGGSTRSFALDRAGLPSGVYFLRAAGTTFSAARSVLVVR
jgi:hypothetical protein